MNRQREDMGNNQPPPGIQLDGLAARKTAQENRIREKRGVEGLENVCSLLDQSLSLLYFAPSFFRSMIQLTERLE